VLVIPYPHWKSVSLYHKHRLFINPSLIDCWFCLPYFLYLMWVMNCGSNDQHWARITCGIKHKCLIDRIVGLMCSLCARLLLCQSVHAKPHCLIATSISFSCILHRQVLIQSYSSRKPECVYSTVSCYHCLTFVCTSSGHPYFVCRCLWWSDRLSSLLIGCANQAT
jgi:hypothetical protein